MLSKALLHFLHLPVCFVCWLVLKVVRKEAFNPKWIEISWYICTRHIPNLLCIFLTSGPSLLYHTSCEIFSKHQDHIRLQKRKAFFTWCNQHKSEVNIPDSISPTKSLPFIRYRQGLRFMLKSMFYGNQKHLKLMLYFQLLS